MAFRTILIAGAVVAVGLAAVPQSGRAASCQDLAAYCDHFVEYDGDFMESNHNFPLAATNADKTWIEMAPIPPNGHAIAKVLYDHAIDNCDEAAANCLTVCQQNPDTNAIPALLDKYLTGQNPQLK
jgi:hypothetical protein